MKLRINLLPHREEKRKQLKNDFYTLLMFAALIAALFVVVVGVFYSQRLSVQNQKIEVLKGEIGTLDGKIKEIATLKQDIEALRARQLAVEDLQGDRNQPVYLLDELVKWTPEGMYLRSIKQEGQRVELTGYAQSQERIAEFLRNLGSQSEWMFKPELSWIKSTGLGQGRDAKKVFDFTISAGIKRPREKEEESSERKAKS